MFKKSQVPWNKGKIFPEFSGKNHFMFGKTHTLEARKKISLSKKGKRPWNFGKSPSNETRKKMGLAKIGKPSNRKGKKHTLETRKKLSEINKGKPGYWFGKKRLPFSEEWRKKQSEIHKGAKCHFWKGGITPENNKIRTSLEIRLWKKACLLRDNFTCQKYKTRGGELEVHHINNFADFPELRLAIDNGITFSKKAHKEFHKKYGVKNNTREQLEEFLSS